MFQSEQAALSSISSSITTNGPMTPFTFTPLQSTAATSGSGFLTSPHAQISTDTSHSHGRQQLQHQHHHSSIKQHDFDYSKQMEVRRQNSLLAHREKRLECVGKRRRRSLHLEANGMGDSNNPNSTNTTLDELSKKLTKDQLQSIMQELSTLQNQARPVDMRLPLLKRFRQFVSSPEIEESEGLITYAVDSGIVDLLVSEISGLVYDPSKQTTKTMEVGIANQNEALWALTNLASITGAHTEAILKSVPYAIALIMDNKNELSEHAAWLIGNLAAEDEDVREQLIAQGAFHALVNVYIKDASSTTLHTTMDSSIIPANLTSKAMSANVHHSSFLTTPTSPPSNVADSSVSPHKIIHLQLLRTVAWALSNLLRGRNHQHQSSLIGLTNTAPFTSMIELALRYMTRDDLNLAIESSWILVGCTSITSVVENMFELGLAGALITRIQQIVGASNLNNTTFSTDDLSRLAKQSPSAAVLPILHILSNITMGPDVHTSGLLSSPNSLPCTTFLFFLKYSVLSEQPQILRESVTVLASISSTLQAEYVPLVLSLFPLHFWIDILLKASSDISHEVAWLLYAFARFQSMSTAASNDFSLFDLDEQHVRPLLNVYVHNLRRHEYDCVRIALRMLTLVMQRSRLYVEILQELGVIDALESLPLHATENWSLLRQEAKGLVDKYWGVDEEMLSSVAPQPMEDIPSWRRVH